MPTYEFRCPAGHRFDRMMKMSEAVAELPCAECGQPAIRQVSGGAGLVFKGSGFYLTDYGRNAHRTTGPRPEGASGASGGKAESGTDRGSGGGDAGAKKGDSSTGSSSGGATGGGTGADKPARSGSGSPAGGPGGGSGTAGGGSSSSGKPGGEK